MLRKFQGDGSAQYNVAFKLACTLSFVIDHGMPLFGEELKKVIRLYKKSKSMSNPSTIYEKLLDYAKKLKLPESDYQDFLRLTDALLRINSELDEKTNQLETRLASGATVSMSLRSQIEELKRTQTLLRDALRVMESKADSPEAQRVKATFAYFSPSETSDDSLARGIWMKELESDLSEDVMQTSVSKLRESFTDIWNLIKEFNAVSSEHKTVLQDATWQHNAETGNVFSLITSKEAGLQSLLNAVILQFLAAGVPMGAVILAQVANGNPQVILEDFIPALLPKIEALKATLSRIPAVSGQNLDLLHQEYQALIEQLIDSYGVLPPVSTQLPATPQPQPTQVTASVPPTPPSPSPSLSVPPQVPVVTGTSGLVGYYDPNTKLKRLASSVLPPATLETFAQRVSVPLTPPSEQISQAGEDALQKLEERTQVVELKEEKKQETESREEVTSLTDAQKVARAKRRKLAEGKISAYVRIRPPSETTLRNAGILPEKLTPPYVYTKFPNPLIKYSIQPQKSTEENFFTVSVMPPDTVVTPEMKKQALDAALAEKKRKSDALKKRRAVPRSTVSTRRTSRPRRTGYVGSFKDYEYAYSQAHWSTSYVTDLTQRTYFLSTQPKIPYPSTVLSQIGVPYAADGVLDDTDLPSLSFRAKTDEFYKYFKNDVMNFVNGQDVLIVAYGPSGSGKSANTRVIAENAIKEMQQSPDFEGLWMAFVDLYSGAAYDIGKAMEDSPVVKGRSLEGEIAQLVNSLAKSKINVTSPEPLWKQVRWIPVTKMKPDGSPDIDGTFKTYTRLARKVNQYRVISPTPYNIESSRSHLLTLMRMTKVDPNLFTIVDLAGEEKFGAKIGEDTHQKILQSLETDWVDDPRTDKKYVDSVASSLGTAWSGGKWKDALTKRAQGTRVNISLTPSTKGMNRLKGESRFINSSLKGLERFITRLGEKNIKTIQDAAKLGDGGFTLPTVLFKLTNPAPQTGKTSTLISFLIAVNRNPAQLAQNFQALSYANLSRNITLKYEFKRYLFEVDPTLLHQYQTLETIQQELGSDRHLVAHLADEWLQSLRSLI